MPLDGQTLGGYEPKVNHRIDIFGSREDGIVEIDVAGWISAATMPQLNLAIQSFNYNVRGMILDYRQAIVTINPDQLKLFNQPLDCPVAHLIMPMHETFANGLISRLQGFGYKRVRAYDRVDAERWLGMAMRQKA